MNLQKVRYDLALQLATYRFAEAKRLGATEKDDETELLEIFAACYYRYCRMPDSKFDILKP